MTVLAPTPRTAPADGGKRHRWIAAAVHRLSDEAAERAARGWNDTDTTAVILDRESLIGIEGPGCVDCEEPWEDCHDRPCPAAAEIYLEEHPL